VDRVFGKKFPVLLRQLGRKRFVVRNNQGRLPDLLNDVGNGKRLTRTGNA
jgi:hypothetical protein